MFETSSKTYYAIDQMIWSIKQFYFRNFLSMKKCFKQRRACDDKRRKKVNRQRHQPQVEDLSSGRMKTQLYITNVYVHDVSKVQKSERSKVTEVPFFQFGNSAHSRCLSRKSSNTCQYSNQMFICIAKCRSSGSSTCA